MPVRNRTRAFGEKERVLRTPPDEIRLSFPFQNNLTIKQD